MTITAKFPGTCPTCDGQIQPGQRVEWARGEKARHTDCQRPIGGGRKAAANDDRPINGGHRNQRQSRPSRCPARRRGTWTGCSCGSVEEYSKDSDCWTCKHEIARVSAY